MYTCCTHTGFDSASMKRSLLQPAEPAHDQSSANGSFRLFSGSDLDSSSSGHKRRSAGSGSSSQYRNSSFGRDEYHEVDEGSWLDMDIIVSTYTDTPYSVQCSQVYSL
jgi:hypothetical protein